ncbi:CASP10 [Branchiostoma lanceolatum]|uniref:CASP10 protein n=1 Tax=Branchiostoma lanceolatum TaxID=7740 RepID=A0A8K0EYI1_BRALA|nr:CASP10 [Branchiostoma lanceolatum]
MAAIVRRPESCIVVRGLPENEPENTDVTLWLYMYFTSPTIGGGKVAFVLRTEEGTAQIEFVEESTVKSVLAQRRHILKYRRLHDDEEVEIPLQVEPLSPEAAVLTRMLTHTEERLEKMRERVLSLTQKLDDVTQENEELRARVDELERRQGLSPDETVRAIESENGRLRHELYRKRQDQVVKDRMCSKWYEMSHKPRGLAVIINNTKFLWLQERVGAEADTDRVASLSQQLGFDVVSHSNLDHAKMVDVFIQLGQADHSKYHCFVCCIMSHGTSSKVFSSNDVGIDICELMKYVKIERCPSLKGKPKLFFIQACQGEAVQGLDRDNGTHDAQQFPFMSHEADIFLGLSTVSGFVSKRNCDGAPYIRFLTEVFAEFGHKLEFMTMMGIICDKMNSKVGMVSSNHSTLTKDLYFTTG